MKNNDIIFYDFETTGPNPHTAQPVQLAAVAINGFSLEVKEDSIFQSLIRPEFDLQKCEEYNLAPLTDESIAIHGKTREMLEDAPPISVVWPQFVEYVDTYNYQGNMWGRPIAAGQNINKYDSIICERIASQDPYNLGPYDKEKEEMQLFQVRDRFDMLDDLSRWMKFDKHQRSYAMDNLRPLLGIDGENAHDALKDVLDGAFMLCKFLKLYKKFSTQFTFKDSFKKTGINDKINQILENYYIQANNVEEGAMQNARVPQRFA